MFYIQDRQGRLWSRRQNKPIPKAVWETWTIEQVRGEFGYPTFKGCNQIAVRLCRKGFNPASWGAIERDISSALFLAG